jgi:AcrR family transcriptional regulator
MRTPFGVTTGAHHWMAFFLGTELSSVARSNVGDKIIMEMRHGEPDKTGVGSTAPVRIGRKQRKQRTRQLLIDAAIDIVWQQGVEALTTTRLASAADVTQPAFYVHFRNVEQCLEVAAEQLFENLLELQREARRLAGSLITGPDALGRQEVVASAWEKTLVLALSERRLVGLALGHRHAPSSAISRSVREALDRARRDIAEDLRQAALRASPSDRLQGRCELLADTVLWLFLGALEALLQGRYPDRKPLVESLARLTRALFAAGLTDG